MENTTLTKLPITTNIKESPEIHVIPAINSEAINIQINNYSNIEDDIERSMNIDNENVTSRNVNFCQKYINDFMEYPYQLKMMKLTQYILVPFGLSQIIIGLLNTYSITGCNNERYHPSTLLIINGLFELLCVLPILMNEKLYLDNKNPVKKLDSCYRCKTNCLSIIFSSNKFAWLFVCITIFYSNNCRNLKPRGIFSMFESYLIVESILIFYWLFSIH